LTLGRGGGSGTSEADVTPPGIAWSTSAQAGGRLASVSGGGGFTGCFGFGGGL
jgi:hypothetical protein